MGIKMTEKQYEAFLKAEKKRLNTLYSSSKVNRTLDLYTKFYSKGWVHKHAPGDSLHYVSLKFTELDEETFSLGELSWSSAILVCYRALERFGAEDVLSTAIGDIWGEETARNFSRESLEKTVAPHLVHTGDIALNVAMGGLRLNCVSQLYDCLEAHIKRNRSDFIDATVGEWIKKENTPRLRRAI